MHTVHLIIKGRVQGVGFRAWMQAEACRRGVTGWVRNRRDGSVEALCRGTPAAVDGLLGACHQGPRHADVVEVKVEPATGGDDVGASFDQRADA